MELAVGYSQSTGRKTMEPIRRSFPSLLIAALLGALIATLVILHGPIPGRGDDRAVSPGKVGGKPQAARSREEVAREIAKGGYVLYFRHGNRDKWDSVIAFDVYEILTAANGEQTSYSSAVCLSAQGREEAKLIGKVLALAKVPVKAVLASPSCRAQQTALLAFGRIDETSVGLAHTPVTNSRNAAAFSEELKRVLVAAPSGPGEVTVIAAHGNTLENNAAMFDSGTELLSPTVQESGFYVIAKSSGQRLHVVQRFQNLGEFAALAVDLSTTSKRQ
jgi:phosphohistidine phosphatase SixA